MAANRLLKLISPVPGSCRPGLSAIWICPIRAIWSAACGEVEDDGHVRGVPDLGGGEEGLERVGGGLVSEDPRGETGADGTEEQIALEVVGLCRLGGWLWLRRGRWIVAIPDDGGGRWIGRAGERGGGLGHEHDAERC